MFDLQSIYVVCADDATNSHKVAEQIVDSPNIPKSLKHNVSAIYVGDKTETINFVASSINVVAASFDEGLPAAVAWGKLLDWTQSVQRRYRNMVVLLVRSKRVQRVVHIDYSTIKVYNDHPMVVVFEKREPPIHRRLIDVTVRGDDSTVLDIQHDSTLLSMSALRELAAPENIKSLVYLNSRMCEPVAELRWNIGERRAVFNPLKPISLIKDDQLLFDPMGGTDTEVRLKVLYSYAMPTAVLRTGYPCLDRAGEHHVF